MRLASYTATMAAVGGAGLALMAYGGEPLPEGWLDGVVAPGSTVGGTAAILGTWAIGFGTTGFGIAVLARLAWDMWRHRRWLRRAGEQPAVG